MRLLSRKEQLVFDLLTSEGDLYGLEMVHRSRGALKRGTVYTTLNRMIEKGLLTFDTVKHRHQPGPPRRIYRPTAYGMRVLQTQADLGAERKLVLEPS